MFLKVRAKTAKKEVTINKQMNTTGQKQLGLKTFELHTAP